jgi:hypothetical protein
MVKKKRFRVRVECPECACGDVGELLPEDWRDKYKLEGEEGPEVTCPECGMRLKGKVEEVEVEE